MPTLSLSSPWIDEYPESDGEPMAENTLQYEWIVTIKGNIDVMFADRDDVFVAGDLFWYPVQGQPGIRQAPDTLVVFGRPKVHRRSYKQWEEGGVAPQVVWEILSPSNRRAGEMERKFQFYERHGVEEYYVYDPDTGEISGWIRRGGLLTPIVDMQGWVSPLLGVRFEVVDEELRLIKPNGEVFRTFEQVFQDRNQAQQEAEAAQRKAAEAVNQALRTAEEATRTAQDATRTAHDATRNAERAVREAEEAARAKAAAERMVAEQAQLIEELRRQLESSQIKDQP